MWYRLRIAALAAAASLYLHAAIPSHAQAIPKSLQGGDAEVVVKDRMNAWTVGLVGGLMEGTFMRFAEEIRKVLDDGDEMRVLPIVSRGSASNLEDLLYLRGVDVAVTQVDVFEYFREKRHIPNLEQRVNYIIRLPPAEVHIIARDDIHNLEELRGKKVHFAAPGGSSTITGVIAFQRLGINVQAITSDIIGGMDQLRKGEFDAVVRVVQKPVGYISAIPPNSGLHLLKVPYWRLFTDYYAMSELTNSDYPNLIAPGERIETISVPSVLAVYNWPKNTDRYRRVERFTQRLFANFDRLKKPPFHPKWNDVNLAATIPGWTRAPAAEAELQKMNVGQNVEPPPSDIRQQFQTFVGNMKPGAAPKSQAELDAMFREFVQWRTRQGR